MIRTIVVPLDGSSFGEQALPWALAVARRAKVALQLVLVHRAFDATTSEMPFFNESLDRQVRDRETAYLESVAKTRGAAGVPVSVVHKNGEIAQSILEQARSANADLIVMTTHARGALGRFWLGSVADESLREAPCPILLIRPQDKTFDANHEATIKNILVPLDGTEFSEHVLDSTLSFGKLFDTEYTLLRVLRPLQALTLPAGAGSFGEMSHRMLERVDLLHEQLQKDALEYLDKIAVRLRAQGLRVTTKIAIAEQPGVAILEHAHPPVDLISMQSHGRSGLSRLVLGSVADKVLRGAAVPVLVHRPMHK